MPNITQSKKRAFEVILIKKFSNFETTERAFVISDRMPLPDELPLRVTGTVIEKVGEVRELFGRVIILP
jgi:hypothetical protein